MRSPRPKAKALMFDWTGTVADEFELDKAVCKSMEKLVSKKKEIPLSEAKRLYEDLLNSFLGTWKWYCYPLHGKILDVDWKKAQIENMSKITLIPSAEQTLRSLRNKGYKICLLTNAAEEVIQLRVKFIGLSDLFDLIVTSDSVCALKSQGEHFKNAINRLNIDPTLSYSIGDNPVEDIEPARKLGMKTVLCNFGDNKRYYHTNSEHFERAHRRRIAADYIISDIKELMDIF